MKLISEALRIQLGLAGQAVFGGVESARLALKNLSSVCILVRLETGTATTFTGTVRQHDAPSGGNSKDLASRRPHYYMVDGDTEWTKLDADSAVAAKQIAALDTVAGYVAFEIDGNDLDVNGDFDHVSVSLPASGSARNGSVHYLGDSKFNPGYEIQL